MDGERPHRTVMRAASPDAVYFAREQRHASTQGEEALWTHLRGRGLGVRFRRQHPLDDFVLDFYCVERSLAIEMDGPTHEDQRKYDAWRDAQLSGYGIRVLRVSADAVAADIGAVLDRIRAEQMG